MCRGGGDEPAAALDRSAAAAVEFYGWGSQKDKEDHRRHWHVRVPMDSMRVPMDSNSSAGLKHESHEVKTEQQQQQQQQQPVAKRRHVVNVADAAITEGGSSSAPVEGPAA